MLVLKTPFEISRLGVTTNHAGIERCLDLMVEIFCEPIQLNELVAISGAVEAEIL